VAFREAFGISPWEVKSFADSACRGPGTGAGLFHARFANEGVFLEKVSRILAS